MAVGRSRGGPGGGVVLDGSQRLGHKWNGTLLEEEGYANLKRTRKASLLVIYISGVTIGAVLIWLADKQGLLSPLYYVVCPSVFFVLPMVLLYLFWRYITNDVQWMSTHFWMDDPTYDAWIHKAGLFGALEAAFSARSIPFTRTSDDVREATYGFPTGVRFLFRASEVDSSPKATYRHLCDYRISDIRGDDGAAVARDVLSAIEGLPVLGPYDRPAKDEKHSDDGLDDIMYPINFDR